MQTVGTHFSCERRAKASCFSLEIWNFSATFSEVILPEKTAKLKKKAYFEGRSWKRQRLGAEYPIGMMQSLALLLSISLELRSPGLPIDCRDMLSTLAYTHTLNQNSQLSKATAEMAETDPQARPMSMVLLLMAPEESGQKH